MSDHVMVEQATIPERDAAYPSTDHAVLSAVRLGPPAVDWSGIRWGVLLGLLCWVVAGSIFALWRVHS